MEVNDFLYVFAGMNGGYVVTVERKNLTNPGAEWEIVTDFIPNSNLIRRERFQMMHH